MTNHRLSDHPLYGKLFRCRSQNVPEGVSGERILF